MKQILLVIAVLALTGCPANRKPESKTSPPPAADKPDKTSPPKHTADSLELIRDRIANNEAILIDVREKFEWEDGHLQPAVFLPLSELEEGESDESFATKLAKILPKDKIVYCHCVSGGRVMPASAILHKLGYDARPLKSGYKDLLKAGFEKAK